MQLIMGEPDGPLGKRDATECLCGDTAADREADQGDEDALESPQLRVPAVLAEVPDTEPVQER